MIKTKWLVNCVSVSSHSYTGPHSSKVSFCYTDVFCPSGKKVILWFRWHITNTVGATRHTADTLSALKYWGIQWKQSNLWSDRWIWAAILIPEQPPDYYSALLCSNQLLPSFPATCRESGTGWWLRRDWRLKRAIVPQTISQETELREHHWLWLCCVVTMLHTQRQTHKKSNFSFIQAFTSSSPGVPISKAACNRCLLYLSHRNELPTEFGCQVIKKSTE